MKKRIISIFMAALIFVSLLSVLFAVIQRLMWDRYYSMLSVVPEKAEASSPVLFTETDVLPIDGDGNPVMLATRDVFHVLLIGVDDSPDTDACRADAVIVLTVNRKSRKIILCSLLRDLLVSVDGHGQAKLNAAYFYGKEELLCTTLRENFNLEIPFYVTVNFRAFEGAVDALGGVSIPLSAREAAAVNRICREEGNISSVLPEAEGTYRLNGAQALAYARDRGSATGDFDRTRHQRLLLSSLLEERRENSVISLLAAADVILPYISTNLTSEELRSILLRLPEWMQYSITPESVPGDSDFYFDTYRGASVIRIDRKRTIKILYEKLYE